MDNLIDGDNFAQCLYSSNAVSHTEYPEMFNFREFNFDENFDIENQNQQIIRALLKHYLLIVGGVYGREVLKHIPKIMYAFLEYFEVQKIYEEYELNSTARECYRNMTKSPMRYNCENAYFLY